MALQETDKSPQLPCFEGTEVPRLELERDEWLPLVTPPRVSVDEELIARLNHETDVSLGGPATQAVIEAMSASRREPRSIVTARRRGAARFAELIGLTNPESCMHLLSREPPNPLRMVTTTRLLYSHVGEALPIVMESVAPSRMYTHSTEAVERKIQILLDNGVDVAQVLLTSASAILYSDRDRERFLRKVRSVGTNDHKGEVRRRERLELLHTPIARPSGPVEALTEKEQARYARLAAVVGSCATELAAGFPGVRRLDNTAFNQLVTGLDALMEDGQTIRPRQWFELAPELRPDAAGD